MGKRVFQKNITTLYIVYILTVFAWYTHYKYFDIMQAKRAAFLLGTGIYDIIMFITCLIRHRDIKCRMGKSILSWNRILPIMMMLIWGIGLFGCIDVKESIWGYGGKCTGLLVYVLGMIAVLFISEHLEWSPWLTWVLLMSSFVVCQLQVLNRWGYDLFAMYEGMVEEQRRLFISTIGQINYNASLNCMIMAIIMCLFLLCEERISQMTYGFFMMVVFAGSVCCCSDSVYLGLLFILAAQLIYVGFHPEKWWRFVQEVLLLEGTVIILWYVWSFVHRIFVWDITLLLFDFRILSRLSILLFAFILIGSFLQILLSGKYRKTWKIFCVGIIVYVPIQIGFIIRYIMTDQSYWEAISSWGGYRTDIWSRCWNLFEESSIWHKLFGYGFNNVSQALGLVSAAEFDDTIIADAHNIVLNTLITSGIVGVVLWTVFIGIILICGFRSIKTHKEALLIIVGICIYVLQGMVNGPQILTTPFFLVEIGVFLSMIRKYGHMGDKEIP